MKTNESSLETVYGEKTKVRIAIIGASGYGGIQAFKLLSRHPFFEITYLAGERTAGKYWNDIFPYLKNSSNLMINKLNIDEISNLADIALLSLPNGLASQIAPKLLEKDLRVLDLSADYRFNSLAKWSSVYTKESKSIKRNDSDICSEAVYGLPEYNRMFIKDARIIGCPGCFPTASLLSLIPFLKQGLIENNGIIVDAKTGTSGGGRDPKEHLLFSELAEGVMPYGVVGHRHTSEIEQLASHAAGHPIQIQFTPHLIPMVRGILVTCYSTLRDPGLTAEDCKTVVEATYRESNIVEVLPVGTYPSTKWTKNTNKVFISVQVDKRTGQLIMMSCIDNLIKGQVGQAIQCLNIMSGLDEDLGLPLNTYYP